MMGHPSELTFSPGVSCQWVEIAWVMSDAPPDELLEKRRARTLERKHEIITWPKRKVLSHLLSVGSVDVCFDPRRIAWNVPRSWRRRSHVQLTITRADVAAFDARAVTVRCRRADGEDLMRLPWATIYSVVAELVGGVVWQADAPAELKPELRPEPGEPYQVR